MITLIMGTYISFMRSHNHWMCSNHIRLKLKINSIKGLEVLDLTAVMNTMVDVMDQENNVKCHLLNS